MAVRVFLNCYVRQLAIRPSAFLASPKCINNISPLLLIEKSKLSFSRSFANAKEESETESGDAELKAEEVDAKTASKLRTRVIPVEVSMKYLKSNGYATTYGTEPVWVKYRRNFRGQFAPETRKTCIRQHKISTGNPCPICRDEYLVLDHRNVDLLKQFISPYNGAILPTSKTGLCQVKHRELLVAIAKAKDYGLITFDLPVREYDYSNYYKK